MHIRLEESYGFYFFYVTIYIEFELLHYLLACVFCQLDFFN